MRQRTQQRHIPGPPQPRLKSMRNSTPCGDCPKINKDASFLERDPISGRGPINGRKAEPTDRILRIIRHFEECRAVGHFPNDPWVRRHARVLAMLERSQERAEHMTTLQPVLALLGTLRTGMK